MFVNSFFVLLAFARNKWSEMNIKHLGVNGLKVEIFFALIFSALVKHKHFYFIADFMLALDEFPLNAF